jgi:DnaJ-class molecular chaperone
MPMTCPKCKGGGKIHVEIPGSSVAPYSCICGTCGGEGVVYDPAPITINITVSPGTDAVAIADEVRAALKRVR